MAGDVAPTVFVSDETEVNRNLSADALTTVESVSYSVILSALIAATIFGNVLVVLSVFTYAPLKTIPNFFVASLACADLAVAVLVMPFNVANFVQGRWSFGAVWCNAWLTFDILTCTASILHLCAIALDRYNAIHDPINYAMQRTRRRVLVKIAVVWATSAVISVPPLIGWNSGRGGQHSLYDADSQQCQLTDDRSFVLYSASGSFYIPLAIMTVVYVRIFQATRARLRARASAAASCLRPTTSTLATATTCVGRTNGLETTLVAEPDAQTITAITPAGAADAIHQEEEEEDDNDADDAESPAMTTEPLQRTNRLQIVDVVAVTDACPDNNAQNLSPVAGPSKRRDPSCELSADVKRPRRFKRRRRRTSRSDGVDGGGVNRQLHDIIEEKQRISLSKERRAARTMAIIMGAFVVCWLPFFLMYVIFPFCVECAAATNYRIVNAIVWLGYVNSTLNPIIYTVFNVDFRRGFKNLLTARCHRTQR